MQLLTDSYKQSKILHHAYLIEGDASQVLPKLFSFFEEHLNISTKGNPDFYCTEYETFGINDGRFIQDLAAQKAVTSKQLFVLVFHTMTHEAQNAMLKILEEPTAHTHFFLVTKESEMLLPTLLSRLFIIREEKQGSQENTAGVFLKAKAAERLKLLKDIIESKDKRLASDFLDQLEETLYSKLNSGTSGNVVAMLQEIENAKKYIYNRGSSVKMILEHIALTI